MPTITKYRTWCKRCLDFKLHVITKIDSTSVLVCNECKMEDTGYSIKDIPEDKLMEQRARYTHQRKLKFQKLLNIYNNPGLDMLKSFMSSPGDFNNIEIIESDAGQKWLDDKKKEEIHKAKQIKKEKIIDYSDNYSKLNRNDKCACGSGKKYKQCHLLIFQQERISKN